MFLTLIDRFSFINLTLNYKYFSVKEKNLFPRWWETGSKIKN